MAMHIDTDTYTHTHTSARGAANGGSGRRVGALVLVLAETHSYRLQARMASLYKRHGKKKIGAKNNFVRTKLTS
jgi:hypothetical protein